VSNNEESYINPEEQKLFAKMNSRLFRSSGCSDETMRLYSN